MWVVLFRPALRPIDLISINPTAWGPSQELGSRILAKNQEESTEIRGTSLSGSWRKKLWRIHETCRRLCPVIDFIPCHQFQELYNKLGLTLFELKRNALYWRGRNSSCHDLCYSEDIFDHVSHWVVSLASNAGDWRQNTHLIDNNNFIREWSERGFRITMRESLISRLMNGRETGFRSLSPYPNISSSSFRWWLHS